MFDLVGEEIFECGETFEMVRVFRHRVIHDALEAGDDRDVRSEFVEIPTGTFTMGISAHEAQTWSEWYSKGPRLGDHETPAVEVAIERPFLIARVPATLGLWDALTRRGFDVWDQRMTEGLHLPVTGVSWFSASASAQMLGCRLPREAEWEYACRAGTDTTFFFGSTEFEISKYAAFKTGGLVDVASRAPNPFGLYDMLGNVWEWCSDWWAPQPGGSVDEDPMLRPLRGGGYTCAVAPDLACARREFAGIHSHADDVGVRLVADVETADLKK